MADDRHVVAPEVLYKYVSADRALDVLPEGGNGTLRATPPAALNDPLECATRCSAVYPSDDKEIDEIVRVLNSFVPDPPLTNREVEDSRRRLGTQAWNDLFRKRLSRRLGVVSFSASAHHPLLWALFRVPEYSELIAQGGRGSCVCAHRTRNNHRLFRNASSSSSGRYRFGAT